MSNRDRERRTDFVLFNLKYRIGGTVLQILMMVRFAVVQVQKVLNQSLEMMQLLEPPSLELLESFPFQNLGMTTSQLYAHHQRASVPITHWLDEANFWRNKCILYIVYIFWSPEKNWH